MYSMVNRFKKEDHRFYCRMEVLITELHFTHPIKEMNTMDSSLLNRIQDKSEVGSRLDISGGNKYSEIYLKR
jgi:hypothetical protein